MITKLETEFAKTSGDMAGFKFTQLEESDTAYMYMCEQGDAVSFEVFEKKTAPLCINFDRREYSTTDFKECYPKSNDFGVWAWSYTDQNKAYEKFNSLK